MLLSAQNRMIYCVCLSGDHLIGKEDLSLVVISCKGGLVI
jgi:hypothetical protein